MASLEQIANLQVALSASTVNMPPIFVVKTDFQRRIDSIAQVQFDSVIALKEATSVGPVHNTIIRAMVKDSFPILSSTHTEIANEVLRQYCLVTKESVTAELQDIASKEQYGDMNAYLKLPQNIRFANQRYMDSAKKLSGTQLRDYTDNYIRRTKQTIKIKDTADQINTFANVAYNSKIMWNIKDE